MKAHISTYGGEIVRDSPIPYMRYVQHWQLFVDDVFVADTSTPQGVDLFQRIVDAINRDDAAETRRLRDRMTPS
jgi:hypothetical protein